MIPEVTAEKELSKKPASEIGTKTKAFENAKKSPENKNYRYTDVVMKEIRNKPISEVGSKTKAFENSKELRGKTGGSYGEIFREGEGDKYEIHHMPADSASYLERNDGPAIKMEKEDHRQTASCGSSREAREYRASQKELIDKGDFHAALQKDIDDIHGKFGNKYDEPIAQMNSYVNKLESEGKIYV